MARPRTMVGSWGKISATPYVTGPTGREEAANGRKPTFWIARARLRGPDGKPQQRQKRGRTKAEAERLLTEALRDGVSSPTGSGGITPATLVKVVAESYRAEKLGELSTLAINTRTTYTSTLNRHVIGGSLANLAVREVKVGSVDRWLTDIGNQSGPGAAKTARSILHSIMQMAVKHDAITHNPVRGADPIKVKPKPTQKQINRSFSDDELASLDSFMVTDARANRRDLPDLVRFLIGTGVRIGEACALRWSDLDLAAGTAQIQGTLVRVPGDGMHRQDHGKSDAALRPIALPPWLVARLRDRQLQAEANEWDVIFATPTGQLRDVSNTTKQIRVLLDSAGFPWTSSHGFRRTAATRLGLAGVPDRQSANHLGHRRTSMTTDTYMARRTITPMAAEVL